MTMAGQHITLDRVINNDTEYDALISSNEKQRDFKLNVFDSDEGLEEKRNDNAESARIKLLTNSKLEFDTSNAKRVYETYSTTRFFAWAGFILGLFALVIQVIKSINGK